MARFIRPLQRSANLASSAVGSGCRHPSVIFPEIAASSFRTYRSNNNNNKSPMEANLVRILGNQIHNHFEYAPLYQPVAEIGGFQVTDKPGEQLITLTGTHGDNEDIKIEATTFDCCVIVPLTGEGPSRGEERHHISLRVFITRGQGSKPLEVICSSWPEFFEVQRLFVSSDLQQPLVKPYMGRYFRALDIKLQNSLYKFLGERGIDNELSYLLHVYMKNRKKMDSIHWLQKVQSFVEL